MYILEELQTNPIIASVRDLNYLDKALESDTNIICLLVGDISNITELVDKIKRENKYVLVHVDLIKGLSRDPIILQFLQENLVDGIISTSNTLIREAKARGMFAIQRIFLLDTLALQNGISSIKSVKPDAIEVLPALPKIIERIHEEVDTPIIGGGFIQTKDDIFDCLKSGAIAVSSSTVNIWNL